MFLIKRGQLPLKVSVTFVFNHSKLISKVNDIIILHVQFMLNGGARRTVNFVPYQPP